MAFVHGRHALLAVLVHTVAAARGTSQDLAKFHVPTVLIAHEDLTNASSLIIHRRSVVGEVGKMPRKVWLEQGKGGCPKLHSVDYSHECRDCGGITYECLFAGVLSEGCTEETLRRCRECAHYEEVYIVDCGEYGPTDYPLYFPKSPVQEKLRKRGGKQVQIELRTFAPSVSGGSASSVRGLVVQPIDKAYADLMVKHKGSAFKSVKLLGKKTVDSNKAALWVQTVLSSLTREAKCPCVCDVVKDFSMGSSCVETVGLEVKEELSVAPRYCLPLASPVPYLMCCPTSASTWPDFRSSKFRPLKDHVTCLGPGDWTTLRSKCERTGRKVCNAQYIEAAAQWAQQNGKVHELGVHCPVFADRRIGTFHTTRFWTSEPERRMLDFKAALAHGSMQAQFKTCMTDIL